MRWHHRLGARCEVAGKLFLNPIKWHALAIKIRRLPDLGDFVDVAEGTNTMNVWGSAIGHQRVCQPWPKGRRRGRRRCYCGCGKLITHIATANGVCLMSNCELVVRRWVKDWRSTLPKRGAHDRPKKGG